MEARSDAMHGKKTERLRLIKARYRKLILEPKLRREYELRQDGHEEHQDPWGAKLLHKHAVDDKLEHELD